jgi:hypothetical protein
MVFNLRTAGTLTGDMNYSAYTEICVSDGLLI